MSIPCLNLTRKHSQMIKTKRAHVWWVVRCCFIHIKSIIVCAIAASLQRYEYQKYHCRWPHIQGAISLILNFEENIILLGITHFLLLCLYLLCIVRFLTYTCSIQWDNGCFFRNLLYSVCQSVDVFLLRCLFLSLIRRERENWKLIFVNFIDRKRKAV